MKKIFIPLMLLVFLMGCASIKPTAAEFVKFDEEIHKSILKVAETRIKYGSCDIGLIDGLGLASSIDFPITTVKEVRAILQNPAISIALSEAKDIMKNTKDKDGNPYWKIEDYSKCKLLGIDARVRVLSTIDILKLFPQLAPYLAAAGL